MATKKSSDSSETTTTTPDAGAPEGAPEAVTTPVYADPGPDVSNADIDVANLSVDARDSTYHENPDPNPDELRPAPGPSVIQVLGTPTGEDEADRSDFESTRGGGTA